MKNNKIKSSILSVLALSLLVVGATKIDASTIVGGANTWDLSKGGLEIDSSSGGSYYVLQGKTVESEYGITVSNRNVKIILDNADINTADLIAPLTVGSGAVVTLELIGNNIINGDLGIIVNKGGTLNIEGEGRLDITASSSAAIGNVMYDYNGLGDINIRGGEIYAQSYFGSAIGTSKGTNPIGTNSLGDINITGGYVEAYGSPNSAGIGAGPDSIYGNIYIGGTAIVKAVGASGGAGIGGGIEQELRDLEYGHIVISDEAIVEAYSYFGAGIGAGKKEIDETKDVSIDICGNASVYSESQWGQAIGNGVGKQEVADIDILVQPVETSTSVAASRGNTEKEEVEQGAFEEEAFEQEGGLNNTEVSAVKTINNSNSIRLSDNSSVSCVSYYGDAIGNTIESNVVNLRFADVSVENTEVILSSDEGHDIVIDIPSMAKSVATKLKTGEYVCDVVENGLELDNMKSITFNPVVVSGENEVNNVKIVNATEVLPSTVYVDNNKGSNANTGFNPELAIKDFDKAYSRVASSGTIVVCSEVKVNSNIIKDKNIELTSKHGDVDYRDNGAELVLNFNDVVITDNVKFNGINVNMEDSNMESSQVTLLQASDVKFRKEINSQVINATSVCGMNKTMVGIDRHKDSSKYVESWGMADKLLEGGSLRGQVLCLASIPK